MLKIIGTKSEIQQVCFTFATGQTYCAFMQNNIVKDCKGLQCKTLEQVYECGMKHGFFIVKEEE